MVFEKDARVQALATLFDAGTEDAQGRTYSQKRKANGLGDYCLGTITRVYRVGTNPRNFYQKYMVKWDEGTSTPVEEQHLTLFEGTVGSEVTNADDESSGLSDFLTRDGELTDDENEDVDDEGAPDAPVSTTLTLTLLHCSSRLLLFSQTAQMTEVPYTSVIFAFCVKNEATLNCNAVRANYPTLTLTLTIMQRCPSMGRQ